jgi:hypothetical protein
MRIKSFGSFINESKYINYYEAEGKSGFSRWLRRVGNSVGLPNGDSEYTSYYASDDDYMSTLKSASNIIALGIKGLTKGTAAFLDLITPESSSDFKGLSDEELAERRKRAIERWKEEKLSDKVTDEEAEEFFKSGVLKGKKYFGEDYNILKPRNRDEEMYGDSIRGMMKSYYRGVRRSR